MESRLPYQVKYTIRFNNGHPEKDGRFAFSSDDPFNPALLKSIADRESDLKHIEYIFGSIWPSQESDPDLGLQTNPIFSFTRTEIETYLTGR